MEEIILNTIQKNSNTLTFVFSVSAGLQHYFSGKPFCIDYPMDISSIPDAIATIPFVCNVLPIIWLTNSKLVLRELDKAFYECIPNVKKGYETMFPESAFEGNIVVDHIVPCDIPSSGRSAAFFSGGLDAVQTLISHLDEKPDLISIWGSDIRYENEKGWEIVHRGILEASKKYNLEDIVIRSSFRAFDSEDALHQAFHKQLKDGWWHGVKHSLGLLGHAAPYAYLRGLSVVYIASTNCPADGPVRCASNPLTDDNVRFANCKVVHDGFKYSRQDKVRNVVSHFQNNRDTIALHVCWESQSGGNCCRCEKCYRTITGIIAEGGDPSSFGFDDTGITLPHLHRYIVATKDRIIIALREQWPYIQRSIIKNKRSLKKTTYWKHIAWIPNANFCHPETLKMPFSHRLRAKLSQFKFYQVLHELKSVKK